MGIDKFVYREHARAPRGKLVFGEVSGKKYKRANIVAGRSNDGVLHAPMQYQCSTDSILFEAWFERYFLPSLPQERVIIMDNASFHRKKILREIISGTGHELIFLPAYSPDLNPIENFWSWLKRKLRKILKEYDSFDDALSACFEV